MPFHSRDKSIEAVEWIPRVPGSQRQNFEAAARRNGFDNFQITESDKTGWMVPAGNRSEYFPVYFSGPRPAEKSIVGYDVGSEPVRLKTLCEARDSGKAVASGRIDFVMNSSGAGGFLVCLPVYEKDKPIGSVVERRQRLLGFVIGVFRPSAMLDTALGRLKPEGIDVGLFDASAPASKRRQDFHASRTREDDGKTLDLGALRDSEMMRVDVKLDVAGHQWTVACLPTPTFDADRRTLWPWGVMVTGLAFTGLLAAYLWMSVDRKTYLEQKVREKTADVRRANEEVIDRLVSAAQWSDEETGMHIRRTGMLCEVLARAAGWFGDEVDSIRQAAPMHDIGKIGIPDAILQKPGTLTPEEYAVMKTHTRIGADILSGSQSPMLQMARDIALSHHERWDGKGYPRGLSGKGIPEAARIVAIVDVYDALSHDRVYRPALPEAEVLTIMQQGAGTHFDPLLMTFFFLHLSEIRRIAKEHPDDSWVGRRLLTWGENRGERGRAISQQLAETPTVSTEQPSVEQSIEMA
jgi:CHASE1-domain containing sensor protein